MDVTSKKPKPKRRVLHEEEFNRDGHWYRSFTVRTEVWPIIEHWASEHGYHLVALKGKKRSYQKGNGPAWYTTVIDLKQNENEFTITSWVKVGFTARCLSFFMHPRELPIDATGWKGSVVRRKAVHELNVLLERLRQAAIADSLGFHIADLDSTTRLLSALILGTFAFFLTGLFTHLDPDPVLMNDLLRTAAKPVGILAGLSLLLLTIHNFVIIKRFKKNVWKGISTGVVFSTLAVLTVIFLSQVSQDMSHSRFVQTCVDVLKDPKCQQMTKDHFSRALREMKKDISIRPK